MTHPWADGLPVTVTVDEYGIPVQLLWGEKEHRITRIFKRWQIDVDWWSATGHVWLLCFHVYTNYGLVCIICDIGEQEWRLLRIFD